MAGNKLGLENYNICVSGQLSNSSTNGVIRVRPLQQRNPYIYKYEEPTLTDHSSQTNHQPDNVCLHFHWLWPIPLSPCQNTVHAAQTAVHTKTLTHYKVSSRLPKIPRHQEIAPDSPMQTP